MQESAPDVEERLILVGIATVTEQARNPLSHPVRRAHSLVAIRSDTEAFLIICAQAQRRLDRRDVRQELVHAFGQERADNKVGDRRLEQNRLLRLLDDCPAALVPNGQLGRGIVLQA